FACVFGKLRRVQQRHRVVWRNAQSAIVVLAAQLLTAAQKRRRLVLEPRKTPERTRVVIALSNTNRESQLGSRPQQRTHCRQSSPRAGKQREVDSGPEMTFNAILV